MTTLSLLISLSIAILIIALFIYIFVSITKYQLRDDIKTLDKRLKTLELNISLLVALNTKYTQELQKVLNDILVERLKVSKYKDTFDDLVNISESFKTLRDLEEFYQFIFKLYNSSKKD